MADVYDRYLRVRLLDVILKRDNSSTVASPLVTMDKVQHISGSEYKVQGSESWHRVDLAIGMCSCPASDRRAACKHQLAASQFSAVKLMFDCTPSDKYLLSKIVYGDKSPYDISFFLNLGDEQEGSGIEQEGCGEQASGDNSLEQKINECTNILAGKLSSWKSECTERTLDIGLRRLRALKNPSQLCSYLTTDGSSVCRNSGALKRKITYKSKSIARRKIGQPREKAALMRGRVVKLKRNLT